jgi:hypothetical protein
MNLALIGGNEVRGVPAVEEKLAGSREQPISFLFPEVKRSSMRLSHNGNRFDTTLGELLATISDVAFELPMTEKRPIILSVWFW